jgi:dTDP-4-dehydrorhamnose 3,5-epimerase
MHWCETPLEDLFLFEAPRFHDERGFFSEVMRTSDFPIGSTPLSFVQWNMSRSHKNVLRGIHACARPPGQAKLVVCTEGTILDVVVDLRLESRSFGLSLAFDLSADRSSGLLIGEGLGHGFMVRSDVATVMYLTTTEYQPDAEFAVNAFDPDLDLDWGDRKVALRSKRDWAAPSLRALKTQVDSPLVAPNEH